MHRIEASRSIAWNRLRCRRDKPVMMMMMMIISAF